MNAGRMKWRATFQRLDTTPDDYGNATSGTWADLFNGTAFWCHFKIDKGIEIIRAGALHAPTTARIMLRLSTLTTTITAADRAVIDGVNWNIRHIDDSDPARAWLWLTVEHEVAQ